MKNINRLFVLSLLVGIGFIFSNCNNEPEVSNVSRITYFPDFKFEGSDFTLLPCNSDYTIPPVTAFENGIEIPVTTTVEGILGPVPTIDLTKADNYIETSSAVNQDGYAGQVVRNYWVACTGDLTSSIEGLYVSDVVRNAAVNPQYFGMKYVLIRKVGDNQFEISDAIGGYYDIGRLYGPTYRATGVVITANDIPGNSFTFSGPVGVGAFGGSVEIKSMEVDATAKTIHFISDWYTSGYVFDVTLTQVAL